MKSAASSAAGAALSHVFVVMLENRSFDHMLGFSNIRGKDAATGQPTAIEGLTAGNGGNGAVSNTDPQGAIFHPHTPADWAMAFDPPHDFLSVQEQLCGPSGTYTAQKQRNGGFYDHVYPLSAVPLGDAITNAGNNHHNFNFALLGVRVPAIIVSPFVPRGTIDHTLYDHTSILATLEQLFNLSPLTNRDRDANTLSHLFSLETPRTAASNAPTALPASATSGIACEELAAELTHDAANLSAPLDSTLEGFLHVAFLRDQQVTPPAQQPQRTAQYQQITTKGQALAYMDQVRQRLSNP